jgi:hypothetical protein
LPVRLRIEYHEPTGLERRLLIKVDEVEATIYHPAIMDEVAERVRGLCTVKFRDETSSYSDYLYECPSHAIEQIKRFVQQLREEGWAIPWA